MERARSQRRDQRTFSDSQSPLPPRQADHKSGSSSGTGHTSFLLHPMQRFPSHRALNSSITPSINAADSVQMPISKLRLASPLAPSPAPVRLALPRYIT